MNVKPNNQVLFEAKMKEEKKTQKDVFDFNTQKKFSCLIRFIMLRNTKNLIIMFSI